MRRGTKLRCKLMRRVTEPKCITCTNGAIYLPITVCRHIMTVLPTADRSLYRLRAMEERDRETYERTQILAQMKHEIAITSSFERLIITIVNIHVMPHCRLAGSTVRYIAKKKFRHGSGAITYEKWYLEYLIDYYPDFPTSSCPCRRPVRQEYRVRSSHLFNSFTRLKH